MNTASTIIALGMLAVAGTAAAIPRTSVNYSVGADIADAGGRRSTSASYSEEGSIDAGGTSTTTTPSQMLKAGFFGQLYEVQSLAVAAAPSSVTEGQSTQLSCIATMDDDSRIVLLPGETLWALVNGAITNIAASGLATAGDVFVNAPATVRGSWAGIQASLTFTVLNATATQPADTVADPVFSPQLFSPGQAGLYQGLLMDSLRNGVGAVTGLTLNGTRGFTCKVIFNGVTYSLAGSFMADGSFAGQIPRKGTTALEVTLHVGTTSAGGLAVQASVNGDATSSHGLIAQAPYTKATPAPAPATLVKSYTFLLPATTTGAPSLPEGDGYGSAKISTLGVITASGKTGDGIAFSHTGYLTADRHWHCFQSLYSGKGQLTGVVTFRDVPGVSDLDGGLRWVKNPNSSDTSYSTGFSLSTGLVGAVYTPPPTGIRALGNLANQDYNARLTLAGSSLPGSGMAKTLTWLGTNALAYYGPETLSGTTSISTGILTGSYYDPAIRLTVPFAGAVLQKQGLAAGNFLAGYKTGYLLVEPGTGFPFPGSEGAGAPARLILPGTPATRPVLSPASFSTAAAGTFTGLLKNGADITGGLDSVVITSTGSLTGTVVIEGRRYAFKGTLGSNGTASVTILRTGLPAISGDLHLALAGGTLDGFQLTGTFTADDTVHAIDAQRAPVFTKLAPAPQAGKYTVAMPAPVNVDVALEPGGDGFASLTMDYAGNNTGTLTLADGTTTTFSGRVSRLGDWYLVRSLYSTGLLAGRLTFRDVPGISDLDGQWHWMKPNAVPKTTTYPAGFNVTRGVIGSTYTPPLANHCALTTLASTNYNAWLRLSGPDMSQGALTIESVDRAVTWSLANKILYYGPDKATITFTSTTGLATGSYQDAMRGVNISFGGALMQKQGLLAGRYTASKQSGRFSIEKR